MIIPTITHKEDISNGCYFTHTGRACRELDGLPTGYGRDRHGNLKNLIGYDDWQQTAKRELDRRATEAITSLDSETLIAIAQGEIFVDRIARDVLKLLQADRAEMQQ